MPTESSPVFVQRELEIRPTREQVLTDVRQIVGAYTEVAPETIQEGHSLEFDLGCDSLDVVEIAMEVEEHFGISIPDEIEGQTRTVGGIVQGVLELLGVPPGRQGD